MSYINNNYFKHGSWNVICDVCGVRFKADQVRKRWDNLIVCDKDWEADHPQKYIRARADPKPVPYIRTEPTGLEVTVCYASGRSAYSDMATADCSQADNNSVPYANLI